LVPEAGFGRRSTGPGTVRPYPGALEVIRWFQLQQSTFVELNTSRPERLRADTLHSLNALGRHVRVQFHDDLLHMNQSGDQGDAVASKIEGLRAFTRAGYRPVAFVTSCSSDADDVWIAASHRTPYGRRSAPRTESRDR
jgi:hypothetical protein